MASKRFILYVNVGELPKTKAEEHIRATLSLFRDGQYPFLDKDEKIIGLPIRKGDTRLEEIL